MYLRLALLYTLLAAFICFTDIVVKTLFLKHVSFWLFTLALLLISIFVLQKRTLKPDLCKNFLIRERAPLLASLIITGVLLIHGYSYFRVVLDEQVLSSISLSFYDSFSGLKPARAHYIENHYFILNQEADKRPLLFPYIISLIHYLSGYRIENVFFANTAFAGLFAFISIKFLRSLGYNSLLSIILVGFISVNIIFIDNALSGHFEILNLVFLALWIYTLIASHRSPSDHSSLTLLYASLLLANIRYENIAYVLLTFFYILITRNKNNPYPSKLTPSTALITVSLSLNAALALSMLFGLKHSFQPEYASGGSVFGVQYLQHNFFALLSALSKNIPSFLVFALAVISLVLWAVKNVSRLVKKEVNLKIFFCSNLPIFIILLAVGAHFSAIGLYYWGILSDPQAERFILPILALLISFFALASKQIISEQLFARINSSGIKLSIFFLPILFVLLISQTKASSATEHTRFSAYWKEVDKFVQSVDKKESFFISNSASQLILRKAAVISHILLPHRIEEFDLMMQNNLYEDVYFIETSHFVPGKGIVIDFEKESKHIYENYDLEEVESKYVGRHMQLRIYKVLSRTETSPKQYIAPEEIVKMLP